MIGISVVGADAASAVFARKAATTPAKCAAAVVMWGNHLLVITKAWASGRPGPNVITDVYRSSIELEIRHQGLDTMAVVFSDHPASRRLEQGFVGTDSAGRVYNQPPYAHFGPAAAEIEEAFVDAIKREALA